MEANLLTDFQLERLLTSTD